VAQIPVPISCPAHITLADAVAKAVQAVKSAKNLKALEAASAHESEANEALAKHRAEHGC
jgi:hypothetical protein